MSVLVFCVSHSPLNWWTLFFLYDIFGISSKWHYPALITIYPHQQASDLFQEDTIPCPDEVFPESWIGRRGMVERPARSSDLTPLDCFSWGGYQGQPQNLQVLNLRIRREMQNITADIIDNIQQECIHSLGYRQIVYVDIKKKDDIKSCSWHALYISVVRFSENLPMFSYKLFSFIQKFVSSKIFWLIPLKFSIQLYK